METSPTDDRDLAAIRRLVDAYSIAMDDADVAVLPELFTADGKLEVYAPGKPEPVGTFRGRSPDGACAIARLMQRIYRSTMHSITTHGASVAGDRAQATTYCIAYHVVDDGGVEATGVRYADELHRTADGWRFGVRRATRLWSHAAISSPGSLLIDRAASDARRAR